MLPTRALSAGRLAGLGARPALSTDCWPARRRHRLPAPLGDITRGSPSQGPSRPKEALWRTHPAVPASSLSGLFFSACSWPWCWGRRTPTSASAPDRPSPPPSPRQWSRWWSSAACSAAACWRKTSPAPPLASVGEALAAGAIFTLPAFLMAGAWEEFHYLESTLLMLIGGLLGILFVVILRRSHGQRPRAAVPRVGRRRRDPPRGHGRERRAAAVPDDGRRRADRGAEELEGHPALHRPDRRRLRLRLVPGRRRCRGPVVRRGGPAGRAPLLDPGGLARLPRGGLHHRVPTGRPGLLGRRLRLVVHDPGGPSSSTRSSPTRDGSPPPAPTGARSALSSGPNWSGRSRWGR